METLRELNASLQRHLAVAETELETLRARVQELSTVNVVVFGSRAKMSVAAVTSSNAEGRLVHSSTLATFKDHEPSLLSKGIGHFAIESVQVNDTHTLPFKAP